MVQTVPGKPRAPKMRRESTISTMSSATTESMEDADAALNVSDSADVEEDDTMNDDSDDEEVASAAVTGK